MTQLLQGIAVTLTTATAPADAGTGNELYIGIVGTGGGREFPLDSPSDDFNTGEVEKFALGVIWEGGFLTGSTKFPNLSEPGQFNDPAQIPLDIDQVNFVYLRKQGDIDQDNVDDAYRLKALRVVLYGESPSKRTFQFDNGGHSLWLATENGHVAYLKEDKD